MALSHSEAAGAHRPKILAKTVLKTLRRGARARITRGRRFSIPGVLSLRPETTNGKLSLSVLIDPDFRKDALLGLKETVDAEAG